VDILHLCPETVQGSSQGGISRAWWQTHKEKTGVPNDLRGKIEIGWMHGTLLHTEY
jgi:hypothetical protein